MSGSDGKRPLNDRERRAREAVEGLPNEAARPDFEERLRRAFVAGSLQHNVAPEPKKGERASSRPTRSAKKNDSTHGLRRWVIPLTAAALLILSGWFVQSWNRQAWSTVAQPLATADVSIDGVKTRADSRAASRLRSGMRIQTPADTEWVLRCNDHVVAVLTPGTEVIWSSAPGRAWLQDLRFELIRGEIRFSTGPAFAGSTLWVTTPETRVEVAGTTLAVLRGDAGTCLCVYEGAAQMREPNSDPLSLSAGRRRVVPPAGAATESALHAEEQMKLQMLEDQCRGLFER